MCGGGSKKAAPAPAKPVYSYFPAATRSPQQQAAGIEASGAQSNANYGSELTGGSAPAAATTTPATGM